VAAQGGNSKLLNSNRGRILYLSGDFFFKLNPIEKSFLNRWIKTTKNIYQAEWTRQLV
jgi:hypothetical protein